MIKKLTTWLMGIAMFFVPLAAYGSIVHTVTERQTITKGATLIKDQHLTHAGWQDVYVLRIDLNEKNVAIKPISGPMYDKRETVLQMAQSSGALAAINADFFAMNTEGPSFGPMLESGKVTQAYHNSYIDLGPKRNMGTVVIDDQNNILMDYFSVSLALYSEGTKLGDINSYNKISSYITRPVILDRKYMSHTQEIVNKYPGTYTIVVEDDYVSYKSKQGEGVVIPENGFVVLMDGNHANTYYPKVAQGSNLQIESKVQLNSGFSKMIEDLTFGIGGGGLIMKDSRTYTGDSHRIEPNRRHPRSVVATTQKPGEILLIAVDGRGQSIGATHEEMIILLKRYGAKDAMYLDGGGSTTVVAREEGKSTVALLNRPSDGGARRVANGIGVFTTSNPGTLHHIKIKLSNERSFVGQPIAVSVEGVDENQNPLFIHPKEIKFQVVGVEGEWIDQVFYPKTSGEALIIASVNGVESGTKIVVSEKPRGILVEPSVVNLNTQETKKVKVYGVDAGGFKIPLKEDKISWENTNGVAQASKDQITGGNTGITNLTLQYEDLKTQVSVVVGDTVLRVESFEENLPVWGGDTSHVKGMVQPSKDIKFHGNQSIKMTYTFAKSNQKQVAYTLLNKPISIPNDTNTFNMWVYGRKQGDTLKIEVVDAKGKTHYIKLAETIDFEGWKYLSTPLTEAVALPAKVTKFYAYAHEVLNERTTALYFDHVSLLRGPQKREGLSVATDYQFDPSYRKAFQQQTSKEYSINITGPTAVKSLRLNQASIERMENQLKKDADRVFFTATNHTPMGLEDKGIYQQNTYQALQHKEIQMIMLATDKGGLRQTDATQWTKFKNTLQTTSAQHIVVMMNNNPLTGFSDKREGQALHNYLVDYKKQTGKDVFVVVAGGIEPEVVLEEGIRYIKTPGINNPTDNLEEASFVQFKVTPHGMYYTFKSMVQ